jgi:hypothetical protein
METLLTLALIGLMASFAYPLLRGGPPDPILSACLTLALSFGLLSAALLLAYWLELSAPIIGLGIMLSGALAGASLQRRVGPRPPAQPARTFTRPTRLQGTAWLAIAIIVAAILFNAGYWGLLYDDAISIYGWYGKQIALSGRLPALGPESLYEAYPMLVPLLYAFVQQTTGVFNSPLLALIPALCGVGAIGVAYLLGREIYNRDCGLIAALLIALAPPVSRWASAGYVDLHRFFLRLGRALLVAGRPTASLLLAGRPADRFCGFWQKQWPAHFALGGVVVWLSLVGLGATTTSFAKTKSAIGDRVFANGWLLVRPQLARSWFYRSPHRLDLAGRAQPNQPSPLPNRYPLFTGWAGFYAGHCLWAGQPFTRIHPLASAFSVADVRAVFRYLVGAFLL